MDRDHKECFVMTMVKSWENNTLEERDVILDLNLEALDEIDEASESSLDLDLLEEEKDELHEGAPEPLGKWMLLGENPEGEIGSEAHDTLNKKSEVDATQLYLSEIGTTPLLSAEEEVYYARLVQKGDGDARKWMVQANLRLVVKIARRYINRGLALLDLVAEGNLGLIRAVEKFDPERGFRFSTYATWWIKQNIERGLMKQTRTIHLPIHIIKELNLYLRKAREMTPFLDHEPTFQDIAKSLDKPANEVNRLLRLNEKTLSIDTPMGDDGEKSLLDAVADLNLADPAKTLGDENLCLQLGECFDLLTEKQRAILARRFGLQDHDEATLEAVGKEVDLTRERVRQIQVEALKLLRKMLSAKGIEADTVFA